MSDSEVGRLGVDPLFLGLTRPAMMLGVTYNWFMVNGMIWVTYFIQTSNFAVLVPGAIFTHLLGYIICSKEPRFVDLWVIRMQKCMKCRNTMFHGYTQSFDLY
jgi:type IV secretion system protein VirB3